MRRQTSFTWLVILGITLLAGCASGKAKVADPLESYTDPGDGCSQVVSAIAYADDMLKPLGQEAYQTFDDAVRSRVATVNGTISLEVKDLPSKQILEQARRTGDLADRGMRAGVSRRDRIRLLREYRREAAELVLLCGPYVDPTPTASSSAAG
ncbi:MAG: hypothetical protein ACXV4A_13560 [Actinomycetes bacterium]